MKPSPLLLGLSALALTLPGPVWAKRLRQAPGDANAAALSSMSTADFARQDLNALPPPGASSQTPFAMADEPADRRNASGGLSTRLSLQRRDGVTPPAETGLPAVPSVADRRSAPDTGPRFDLVVNNAPAAQVFLQLGAGAGVNVLVPPEVKGNMSVSLKAVNLGEALDTLRELFGYDFKISGNRVFIYPNSIQTRIYQVNYLAALREGTSSLKVTTPGRANGTAAASGSTGTTATTGSTTATSTSGSTSTTSDAAKVQMTVSTDFWRDLQSSLKELVNSGGPDRSVVVNAAAGVLIVRASPAEHRNVADYLKALRISVERQVMLEAKIVEVTLTDEAQSGVNWSMFRSYSSGGKRYGGGLVAPGVTLNQGSGALSSTDVSITPGSVVAGATGGAGFYGLALQAGNFAALLNFLQSQGDVQVLSSPRIATLNNQKAVLKVGTDAYYPISLGSSSSTTSATAGNATTVNAPQVDTMFSGIVLDVTPRIDANGAILLHVHPIISSIALETIQYSVGSTTGSGDLPKISVSETDSIVRVQDRQIVAIGGLMSQQVSKNKSGVTGLSDLPFIGGLFRQKASTTTKRELVVLIKPTLIGDDGEGFDREEPKTTAAE
jgi:MSHA biogenesis protein MshL